MLKKREGLPADLYHTQSQALADHIFTLLQTIGPCTVGLYLPHRQEPDLTVLTNDLSAIGFQTALPVCQGDGEHAFLAFHRWRVGQPLVEGRYGIQVPANGELVRPEVLVVPCVGFNLKGARLGYGAGWYDKTVARFEGKPPICVGSAFSFALIEDDFAQPHDLKLDWLATELFVKQVE